MTRTLTALLAATLISAAAPAFANSMTLNFPSLTFPETPTPTVTQTCNDLTSPTNCAADN